ncbi:MAG: hypothetical protein AB1413_04675 [Thermodesulfobacteriota bacterium]
MTTETKDKKQLYWDISKLQEWALMLSIYRELPPLLPIVQKGEPGSPQYFIDETRLPKEIANTFREFLAMVDPHEGQVSPEDFYSAPIGLMVDSLPMDIAPIIEK